MISNGSKHIFGLVKVGEKGQIVIPAEARKMFNIKTGDSLMLIGDEEQGLAIPKKEMMSAFLDLLKGTSEDGKDIGSK
jgi:AbrB family looped-hinge helix DNA binding protein